MTEIIREPKTVWMVWTKHGRRPTFCHANRKRAVAEAERLARLNPGKKFQIMRVVEKIHVAETIPTEGAAE